MTDPNIGQFLSRAMLLAHKDRPDGTEQILSLKLLPHLLAARFPTKLALPSQTEPKGQFWGYELQPMGFLAEIILSQTLVVILAALVVAAVLH